MGSRKSLRQAAAFTGARRGELRGMFWENYRGGELLIARSIWNGITTDPKSRKSKAPIPIIPKLAAKLEAHCERLENRKQGRSFPDFIAVNNVLVDKNCRGLIEGLRTSSYRLTPDQLERR